MTLAFQTTVSSEMGMIPVVVLIGYLFVLLLIGWIGYRTSKSGEEDYYLAGRGQGWLISSLTIMATFFSSFALLGAPGMVYREGVVFALVSLNVPVAGFCIYLLGTRIHAAGQARGYVTQADMLCRYYGSPVLLRLLIVLVGIMFTMPYVMMQLKAGGELTAVLFPTTAHSFEIGAIVLSCITAVYIMVGGMRSVAWTDALQCLLLTSGMMLAGIAMVSVLGGWTSFARSLTQLPDSSLTLPGNTGFWTLPRLMSVCLLMPIGGIIQPAQWMRFYSAKDRKTLMRSALIFIVLLTGCFLLGIMLVGLGGQVLYPLQIDEAGVRPHPEIGNYDQILVVVMRDQLPQLLGDQFGYLLASILIVAIMAAAMSTADSNLHALSALITRDVYDQFLRPRATERERVWVGRLVILAATFLALVVVIGGSRPESSLSGFMEMIVGLALFAVAFSVQLLPMTIDVLFIRRGTRTGACVGLIIGLLWAMAFTSLFPPLVNALGVPGSQSLLNAIAAAKSLLPVDASAWGLIPNLLVFVLMSLFTKPVPAERKLEFATDMNA
ncbi:sodium:solute symporter family protein [Rubinisphaera margarita]|uniref:sodium:solute symporter family protein n=1 Tax=Rubinisphaera margarita TaxID=2909586 RepID=UPI001EE99ECE|nr:sodium:solute symporter family protein [Rubinisphaera margarita]MCG6156466.1 sodium:solute symporter family protein [Rubinisphaera margarita]